MKKSSVKRSAGKHRQQVTQAQREQQRVGASRIQKKAKRAAKLAQQLIKDGALGLRPLAASTKRQKRARGYARPGVPMYGRGDLAESVRAVKAKAGWNVTFVGRDPRTGKLFIEILGWHARGSGRLPRRPVVMRLRGKIRF